MNTLYVMSSLDGWLYVYEHVIQY